MTIERNETIVEVETRISLTLRELCERGGVTAEFVLQLLEHGILEPLTPAPAPRGMAGGTPASLPHFDAVALRRLHSARRLHRDLDLNLPGIAVVLQLLEERDALRAELLRLRRRLARFEAGF